MASIESKLQLLDPVLVFNESQEAEFEQLITTIHETDEWIVEQVPYLKLDLDTSAADMGEEAEDKKLSSYPLNILLNGTTYRVLPMAISTIEKRAMDEAKVNTRLPAKSRIRRLNEDFSVAYKRSDGEPMLAKALIRGGNLLALLSERYVSITQKEIFDIFSLALAQKLGAGSLLTGYEKIIFKYGQYTHSFTEALYEIDDGELKQAYYDALNAVGHKNSSKEMQINLLISTSDIGLGSIAVFPMISFKEGLNVPISLPKKIEHRDTTTHKDVENEFTSLFALIEEGFQNLTHLLEIEIKYPIDCAQNIAKKIRLPKDEAKNLETSLIYHTFGGKKITAHDLFFYIADSINSARYHELNPTGKLLLRDSIATIANFKEKDWLKYDKSIK